MAGSRLRPLELPAPIRLLTLLFEVLALGLPREGLIQLLTSRYLRFPGPLGEKPWLLAQALRAAGVRSLRRPYTHPNETAELWDEQRKREPTWGLSDSAPGWPPKHRRKGASQSHAVPTCRSLRSRPIRCCVS